MGAFYVLVVIVVVIVIIVIFILNRGHDTNHNLRNVLVNNLKKVLCTNLTCTVPMTTVMKSSIVDAGSQLGPELLPLTSLSLSSISSIFFSRIKHQLKLRCKFYFIDIRRFSNGSLVRHNTCITALLVRNVLGTKQ